jgi:hypothetical protein
LPFSKVIHRGSGKEESNLKVFDSKNFKYSLARFAKSEIIE